MRAQAGSWSQAGHIRTRRSISVGQLAFLCDAVTTSQLLPEAGPTAKGLKELCAGQKQQLWRIPTPCILGAICLDLWRSESRKEIPEQSKVQNQSDVACLPALCSTVKLEKALFSQGQEKTQKNISCTVVGS